MTMPGSQRTSNTRQPPAQSTRDQNSVSHSLLLDVRDIDIAYNPTRIRLPFVGRESRPIVRGISFTVTAGETFALVGESGSGKTTVARAISGLLAPIRGQILFKDQDITASVGGRPKELHRQIQFVFQNPDASLNPRRRISYILGRPLEFFFGLSGSAKERRVEQLLQDVHLNASYAQRFPMQLSGGERQRVAIAVALAAQPELVLCDEVVSALDVSVQANVLDLLQELQAQRSIAYLFIAHDLAVVRWLAHRVGVMYLGQIVEVGTAREAFTPPFHPYTEMLLQSVPDPDPEHPFPALGQPATTLGGDETLMCPFSPRCLHKAKGLCSQEAPAWQVVSPTHAIRCHIPIAELAESQKQLDS